MKNILSKYILLSLAIISNAHIYAHSTAMPTANQPAMETINDNNQLKTRIVTKINSYKANHIFNAIYSIKQKDNILVEDAVGFADILTSKPLKTTDRMAIASGTKQMTAAAILKLQEQGKLDVNAVISKYLTKDSYYFAGILPEWADKITIHQLLTHTSGLPDYIMKVKLITDKPHKEHNKAIVQFAATQALNFTPGSQFAYSNTGYVMLGLIIEEVCGKDLRSFMQEALFTPLNMTDTELATLERAIFLQSNTQTEFPSRYFAIPTNGHPKFVPVDNNIILAPFADGGVISSLKDLNIWQDALHNGKVLSSASYKLMTTPHIKTNSPQGFESSMGYGLYVVRAADKLIYMHGGNAIGIRGEYIYMPVEKLSINIISNICVTEPPELKNKFDYTMPANQIDIKYLMNELITTVIQ